MVNFQAIWEVPADTQRTTRCFGQANVGPSAGPGDLGTRSKWIQRVEYLKGAEFSWQCFFSSRLPSLAFAAKISHLLHFVAKISHLQCSSIFPLVSGFCSIFFIEFSMVFIDLSMIFIDVSMVFFHFSMVFFNLSMFFFNLCMVFVQFSLLFIDCSRVFIDFYMVFTFFFRSCHWPLEIHDVQTIYCRCIEVYMHD